VCMRGALTFESCQVLLAFYGLFETRRERRRGKRWAAQLPRTQHSAQPRTLGLRPPHQLARRPDLAGLDVDHAVPAIPVTFAPPVHATSGFLSSSSVLRDSRAK